jgi:hypothetical protein
MSNLSRRKFLLTADVIADWGVMMINGSAAKISEVLNIPFSRL